MNSQNDAVLNYIRTNGGITTLDAFHELGITRLSGRIYDLKRLGHRIEAETVEVPRRGGKTAHVAFYRMGE